MKVLVTEVINVIAVITIRWANLFARSTLKLNTHQNDYTKVLECERDWLKHSKTLTSPSYNIKNIFFMKLIKIYRVFQIKPPHVISKVRRVFKQTWIIFFRNCRLQFIPNILICRTWVFGSYFSCKKTNLRRRGLFR